MTLRAPAIPQPDSTNLVDVAAAVKENMEVIKGRLPLSERIEELPATATLAQVITMLNVIARRLNA